MLNPLKNLKKKKAYEEIFINETKLKKLYNIYINKTIFEKILNILVLLAMITTSVGAVLSFLTDIDPKVLILINSFSIFILLIFILELVKDYVKSKNGKDFLVHHWIDILLVAFLSFYFLFMSVLYLLQLWFLDYLKPFFQEMKEMRIFYRFIRK